MQYTFKTNIPLDEYTTFVQNHPSTSFMQMPQWATVKDFSWKGNRIGLYQDTTLVCSALVLERTVFLNYKILYIPRGFVIDYTNKDLLQTFVNEIKKYAKKEHALTVKIDPFICFHEDNIQNIKKKKDIPVRQCFTKDNAIIHQNLLDVGFVHAGYKKEVDAYIQPRYTMAIALKDFDGNPYTPDTLKKTFPKNTRNYVGKYHEVRGVSFSHSQNKEDVEKLIALLHSTEQRQNITLRNADYFRHLMESYPNEAVLFFASVNFDQYISFLENDLKEHPNKEEFTNKQITEAKRLKEKYGNEAIAGATIVMLPTCKQGTKVASFLYAGTNTEILPSLKITNGLMFYRLCYCLEHGCDYCDLGGVDGSLEDHLSTFKSKFHPNVLELVGEYDLIIHKPLFKLFNIALSIRKSKQRGS